MTPCIDCSTAPAFWPTAIICFVVTSAVAFLLWDALRRGQRWVATLVGGILFGEVVEWTNTHGVAWLGIAGGSTYCYPDLPINWWGVPYWVPVGWGGIIYASTWTAQRLQLSRWARPVAAAFLAASIDFSLDPIAELLRFWRWECYPVNYCGVPYDNFIGWYLIVFVYALSADLVLSATKKHWDMPAGTKSFSPAWRRSTGIQWGLALACAFVATVIFFVARALLSLVPSTSAGTGEPAAWIFVGATIVGFTVIAWYAWLTPAGGAPAVSWPVMIVPAIMHVTAYVLLLGFSTWKAQPMLVAAIPALLLAGLFVFATPWRLQ